MSTRKLRAVLAGCGGMGKGQTRILAEHPEFELLAVCDVDEARAKETAAKHGVKAYTDFAEMLAKEKPDTASICTGNTTHAPLTIMAAEAGVKGVYCEKPMAHCMADARAMVETCRKRKVALVVNHQRRVGPDLTAARRLITDGALGELLYVRGNCAGDILSDGTHLVDSLQWLTGDQEVEWVLGQVHRDFSAHIARATKDGKPAQAVGTRYGHVVEAGGMGVYHLKSGLRIELFCGDITVPRRNYQDYEVVGAKGRLWRLGDRLSPNLYISDAAGGPLEVMPGEGGWFWQPLPAPSGKGMWRAVEPLENLPKGALVKGYDLFVDMIRNGTPHPMSGEIALRGFEVIMAIYESARTNAKIILPLKQDRFPLELM